MSDAIDYELLAEKVAEKLADRLAERLRPPEFACGKHNPLGSERAFLDAARRGDFPSFKRSRETVAFWADVVAYMQTRKIEPEARRSRAANDGAALDPGALLDEMLEKRAGGGRKR